jgi:hypothetical protein
MKVPADFGDTRPLFFDYLKNQMINANRTINENHFEPDLDTTDGDSYVNDVYGSTYSKNLAIADPSQALIHADSFEYFIESGAPC